MRTVIDEWKVGPNMVLFLDKPLDGLPPFWKYRIEGKEYDPVSVYDLGDKVIAIKSDLHFKGKVVEFI